MVLKIRLRQQGRKNRLAYRLVVSDSKSPRDGKYVEMVGWYQPCETTGEVVDVKSERIAYWLDKGAQLTEKAQSLVAQKAPEVIKEFKQKKALARAKKCQQRKKNKAAK